MAEELEQVIKRCTAAACRSNCSDPLLERGGSLAAAARLQVGNLNGRRLNLNGAIGPASSTQSGI